MCKNAFKRILHNRCHSLYKQLSKGKIGLELKINEILIQF